MNLHTIAEIFIGVLLAFLVYGVVANAWNVIKFGWAMRRARKRGE
jgi:hypothetical protein